MPGRCPSARRCTDVVRGQAKRRAALPVFGRVHGKPPACNCAAAGSTYCASAGAMCSSCCAQDLPLP
eukprot:8145394-Pyramimonas_sp.AAC.1